MAFLCEEKENMEFIISFEKFILMRFQNSGIGVFNGL